MHEFEGRTAVVTGAASGIGFALARRFVAAGMQVVLADVQKDALEGAVRELDDMGAPVVGVPTDTMDRTSVEQLLDRSLDAFGAVHILCNNAGVTAGGLGLDPSGVWQVPDAEWEWVLGLNLHSVLHGLQVFVPHMLEHGQEGHIVNTASLAAFLAGGGAYGVSKNAVLSLSETLYLDLRAVDAKIGASVLCPGLVRANTLNAERNRPTALASNPARIPIESMQLARELLVLGKEPSTIADAVLAAIEEDRFYILPQPGWDGFVLARIDRVIARRVPVGLIFKEIRERIKAGAEF